jgi:hypothetical protein
LADSEALRARRSRKHRAGDHSLCRRCAAVRGTVSIDNGTHVDFAPIQPPDAPGLDPSAEMRDLAARMVGAHRLDPANAILGAELRKTLLELMPKGKPEADADLTGLFGSLQA